RVLRKVLPPRSLVLVETEVREPTAPALDEPLFRRVDPVSFSRRLTADGAFVEVDRVISGETVRLVLRRTAPRGRRAARLRGRGADRIAGQPGAARGVSGRDLPVRVPGVRPRLVLRARLPDRVGERNPDER